MNTLHVEINGHEAWDTLRDRWEELLGRSAEDSLFMTPTWAQVWWEAWGGDRSPLVISVWDEGELIGLAPFYLDGEDLYLIGGLELSDYLGLLAVQGREAEVYRAILTAIEREPVSWDRIALHNLRVDAPSFRFMRSVAEELGYHVEREDGEVCPYIPLPATWEAYLASLDKKERHEIRRKLRRIERVATSRWYVVDTAAGFDEAVSIFCALHRRSDREKAQFMDARMEAFFRAMGHAVAERGWLQLAILEVDGEPAAAMWNFDYKGAIQVYNSGYEPDLGALSPGWVLLARCIEDAIRRGRREFDFLRGDEDYKFRLGGRGDRRIAHLTVTRDKAD